MSSTLAPAGHVTAGPPTVAAPRKARMLVVGEPMSVSGTAISTTKPPALCVAAAVNVGVSATVKPRPLSFVPKPPDAWVVPMRLISKRRSAVSGSPLFLFTSTPSWKASLLFTVASSMMAAT
jgi:hypothetical protein